MDYLLKAWEGNEIPQISAVELMVLSAGQIILVFFIVACTFGCSFCIFCCELAHKKVHNIRQERKLMKKSKEQGKKQRLPKELLRYPQLETAKKSKWGNYHDEDEQTPSTAASANSQQVFWY